MNFKIEGLSATTFQHLFGQPNDKLAKLGISRCCVDAANAYPCRVSLRDANIGDSLLLLNYEHLPAKNAYQSKHAIYVNEAANKSGFFENEIPSQMRRRLLSIRAFDQADLMIEADVVDGNGAKELIQDMLSRDSASYLHVHYAKRGCFAARVEPTGY